MNQTQVANLALRRFGQSRIVDINENSTPANALRDVWDNARRSALRAHHWNFATKQAELTASANTPSFKWRFSYPLPSDYLRLITCNCTPSGTSVTYFDVQQGAPPTGDPTNQPLALVSNWSTAKIEYVADVPQVAYWDDIFADAVSFKLAEMVAPALMADGGNAAALMAQREFQAILLAMSSDAIESKPRVVTPLQGSSYQRARCAPAEDWPCHSVEGIPVAYDVQFNPWAVSP